MTPTNDAPVTVEPAAELAEMLLVGTETGAFDHTPEEIGLHVMENAQAILNALASAPAGDGVEQELRNALGVARRAIMQAAKDTLWCDDSPAETVVDRIDAALARPRAAVGEREAVQMLRDCANDLTGTASHHGQYAAIDQDRIDALRDAVRDFDALQSPPAKVEG